MATAAAINGQTWFPGYPLSPANQNPNNWINPAAFTSPPTDANGNLLRWGDAGRGLVRAPEYLAD